jgi:hypothetical protein
MTINKEFSDALRHGFSLITAGFGSFAIFEGLTVGTQGGSALPRGFALITTAIGVVVIVLAATHNQKMIAWVDADAFGENPVPALPDEQRSFRMAMAASLIGVVSFIALLLLP